METDSATLPIPLANSQLLYTARSQGDVDMNRFLELYFGASPPEAYRNVSTHGENGELLRPAHMCREFIHDTHVDFFEAKWFADQLNSGSMTAEEAYKKHWSYELSKVLGLPSHIEWRSLLPVWKRKLVLMSDFFQPDVAYAVVEVLSDSYRKSEEIVPKVSLYFLDDLRLCGLLLQQKPGDLRYKTSNPFYFRDLNMSWAIDSHPECLSAHRLLLAHKPEHRRRSVHNLYTDELYKLIASFFTDDDPHWAPWVLYLGHKCWLYSFLRIHDDLAPKGYNPTQK